MSIRMMPKNLCVAYASKGKTAALSVAANKQVAIYNARITNRQGAAINAGIMVKLGASRGHYKFFTKVLTVYTDITALLAAATASVVATATNNDGFIVQADRKFGMIGLTVSNTATGGTYTFEYYNGTAWTTLTTIENFTNFNSTGDKYIVFMPPSDWAVGDGAATAIDQTMYSIRVLHTTAPGDTGAINDLWIAEFLEYFEALGDNVMGQVLFDSQVPYVLEGGESVIPYFSTAASQNQFGAFYSQVE